MKAKALPSPISINHILDYGVSASKRTILAEGEVNSDMYRTIANGLTALNVLGKGDIWIVLNTYGGEVYAALAIYDLIKFNGNPVHIFVNGPCMSAGVWILQAGKSRIATPNSYLMVHEGFESYEGESKTVKKSLEHNKKLARRMRELLLERVNVKEAQVIKWLDRDTYFNMQEALKVGLIDGIAGELKT